MTRPDYENLRVKKVKHLIQKYQKCYQKENLLKVKRVLDNNSDKLDEEFHNTLTELSKRHDRIEMENQQIKTENVELQKKITELTNQHNTIMLLNAKNMNSVVQAHERDFEDKSNELVKIKSKLGKVLSELVETKSELEKVSSELIVAKS